jgi:hypothetical protein
LIRRHAERRQVPAQRLEFLAVVQTCESRSNNPSLKRPICLGAPE